MSKVTVQLGFYFQNQHYAQVEAFIPRSEAVKIPGLKIEEFQFLNTKNIQTQKKSNSQKNKKGSSKMSKSQRSQSKKDQSEEDNDNEQDFQNQQIQMDVEDEGEGPMEEIQVELEEEMEEQKLMKYLEDESDQDQDEIDDDEDLSSISKSMSVIRSNHKTKRQKGQKKDLMQLPDRRPRKDKTFDEANQILRRQEKQIKRKQYLKKQIEAQQKATLDKILNETGKKLKMREEKQNIYIMERDNKVFKTLGDVPKFIMKSTDQGDQLMIHKTQLFNEQMLRTPQIKMKQPCSKCGSEMGKYKMKTKNGVKFACSLNCYKMIY